MFYTTRVASEMQTRRAPLFCTPYNVGVNSIFLPIIPYALATALHDTHLELALILGTAFSGGLIILGLLLRLVGGYREHDIIKYHNFIANSAYAGLTVLSLMATWPFTLQYVREFVPSSASTHSKVIGAAYATTSAWAVAFVANTLIYLVPICRGRSWEHSHPFNLVFRIILPIFIALFAAIFTRVWPIRVTQHLVDSIGFDGASRKVVVNPLALPGVLPAGLPPGLTPMLGPGVPTYQIRASAV
ncbi:hypothetical protein GPECTOR_68g382 [Gonium pectorale]|uniref:Uncharacterized protein n=1 Tax=Gonium pectorale TaxID=33097 RepID=A0A150G526_GONPE|nr:hypothetical protein GPECTOR_68g382 [Gonium pectorale]|eukprot:KXZ44410.1 hypothetical protein GPECTOR_68g382 [Gonium pectorale]